MTGTSSLLHNGARALLAIGLTAVLASCGGGEFAELFVKLISARFNPVAVSMTPASTRTVELEVTCDRAGLDTPFGRLGVRIKLDRNRTLPSGVTAVPMGSVPDRDGSSLYPCATPTANADLRVARIQIQLTTGTLVPSLTTALNAYVEVEPLVQGAPSKDNTEAQLAITVTAGGSPGSFGVNLLLNPTFAEPVTLGGLPTAPGNWRGDGAASVAAESGIAPRNGATMLKFQATGPVGSTNTVFSEQWQIVDVSLVAEDIATGRVRADVAAWFNRVAGGELTDRRFDLRLLAFDGNPADLPARYAAGTWLAQQTGTVLTTGNQWQQATAGFVMPATTRYVLVEVTAYEDIFNDIEGPEFAGHYTDDISLVLTRMP